jgi:hypothetical protein
MKAETMILNLTKDLNMKMVLKNISKEGKRNLLRSLNMTVGRIQPFSKIMTGNETGLPD